MSWIDNLINKGKQQITNAVNTVTNTAQNVVSGAKQTVQNVTSGVQQTINNVTDTYENFINGGNSSQQTQAAAPAPVSTPVNVSATPTGTTVPTSTQTTPTTAPQQTTTPAQTPSTTVPEQTVPSTTTPAQTPSTTVPEQTTTSTMTQTNVPTGTTNAEPVTGFDTYEDYLGNNTTNINNMYQNTVNTVDKQSADMLAALDEKLAAGNKYAGEQLESNLNYNTQAYDQTVANIKQLYETGKITAEKARDLILIAAEEAKNLTYESAERQRQEAETSADVARQRAITDANSAYEQNKASYGARAEALGNMGLAGGGYSDWIDSLAYSQNRAETQAARAESDRVKREAKYNEDMTKLEADLAHSEKKTEAEYNFLERMGELDTTYAANMGEAEQNKLAADQQAKDTYKGQLYENEAEYKQGVLETQQAADSAKLNASNDYIKAIMDNEGELAKFRESVAAGEREAQQVQLALYEQVLNGVSNGTYSKEVAEALAKAYGFNEEWNNNIGSAADAYSNKISEAEAEAKLKESGEKFVGVLDSIASGAFDGYTVEEIKTIAANAGVTLTDDQMALVKTALTNRQNGINEADAEYKNGVYLELLNGAKKGAYTEAEIADFVTRYGLDQSMASKLNTAVQTYNTEQANAKAEQEQANKMANFTDLLGRVNSGQLTRGEVLEIAKSLGFDETKDATQLALLGAAADRFATGTEEDKKLAKTNSFIALLDSANSGAYDSAQISELAAQLGFDANNENDKKLIDMLTTAATNYANGKTAAELKADKEYMNGLYVELMTAASSGDLTEKQINDIASRFGFTGNDLTNLKDAATAAQDKKSEDEADNIKQISIENKHSIISSINPNTFSTYSDSYIDGLVKDKLLTKDDANAVKTYRNEQEVKNMQTLVKEGYNAEAAEIAEDLKTRGVIDPDEYQKTYFDITLNDCKGLNTIADIDGAVAEINNRKKQSKLNATDAENLINYLYANAGESQNISIGASYAAGSKMEYPFTVGNVTIGILAEDFANNTPNAYTKNALTKIADAHGTTNSVKLDGVLYVRLSYDSDNWLTIPQNEKTQSLYNAYSQYSGHQANVPTPKHTPQTNGDQTYINGNIKENTFNTRK